MLWQWAQLWLSVFQSALELRLHFCRCVWVWWLLIKHLCYIKDAGKWALSNSSVLRHPLMTVSCKTLQGVLLASSASLRFSRAAKVPSDTELHTPQALVLQKVWESDGMDLVMWIYLVYNSNQWILSQPLQNPVAGLILKFVLGNIFCGLPLLGETNLFGWMERKLAMRIIWLYLCFILDI